MKSVKVDENVTEAIIGNHRTRSKKKKNKVGIIVISVILLLVCVWLIFIQLNIGEVGSKYLNPKLKNIPIIKQIIPKTSEENPYATYNKEQLINVIQGSEMQLEEANKRIQVQSDMIDSLEQQVQKLQVFEKEHTAFKEEKQAFDEKVASMNEQAFRAFYEKMYPEHAKDIYTGVIKKQQISKEQQQYASMVADMEEERAAQVLENLFETDMDIILSLLSHMDKEKAATILSAMDPKKAAVIIKQLSPQ